MANIYHLTDHHRFHPQPQPQKPSALSHDALALRDVFDVVSRYNKYMAELALGSLLYWGRITPEEFDTIKREIHGAPPATSE